MVKTNSRQFEVEILGLRKPGIGEVFEIEVPPYRNRMEVECVERSGSRALVERTDDGPGISGVRSRVISDRKVAPPDLNREPVTPNEDFLLDSFFDDFNEEENDRDLEIEDGLDFDEVGY